MCRSLQIKKEEVRLIVVPFNEGCRACGEKQFHDRPDYGLQQMAAANSTVREANRAMCVDLRRAVDQGDVTNQ